eukprot:684584-Rhodomonas_salina.4
MHLANATPNHDHDHDGGHGLVLKAWLVTESGPGEATRQLPVPVEGEVPVVRGQSAAAMRSMLICNSTFRADSDNPSRPRRLSRRVME